MHADLNEWGARLAALTGFDAPDGGWAAVQAARRQRESRASRVLPVAAAAAVALVAAGLGWWLQETQRELASAATPDAPVMLASAAVRAENARLEELLATLPERQVMRGRTAFTVAELEDRLALLDDRLSRVTLEPNAPERAERLWRQRVDVMNSLVQVRYADAIGTY